MGVSCSTNLQPSVSSGSDLSGYKNHNRHTSPVKLKKSNSTGNYNSSSSSRRSSSSKHRSSSRGGTASMSDKERRRRRKEEENSAPDNFSLRETMRRSSSAYLE